MLPLLRQRLLRVTILTCAQRSGKNLFFATGTHKRVHDKTHKRVHDKGCMTLSGTA